MELHDLQSEVGAWHRCYFPMVDSTRIVLKLVEEVGELAKAREKRLAGAPTGPLLEEDAIGDIVVCLAALCARESYELERIVRDTLNEITSRSAERIVSGKY